ncbi:GD15651 [Drosophila simulans]|uniref:GD15651 n=1 Tax=Drosophila simulans TaxID=7240 RepID=B4R6X3_DROSI|nr:GD15651 [Drosophila simulans]
MGALDTSDRKLLIGQLWGVFAPYAPYKPATWDTRPLLTQINAAGVLPLEAAKRRGGSRRGFRLHFTEESVRPLPAFLIEDAHLIGLFMPAACDRCSP